MPGFSFDCYWRYVTGAGEGATGLEAENGCLRAIWAHRSETHFEQRFTNWFDLARQWRFARALDNRVFLSFENARRASRFCFRQTVTEPHVTVEIGDVHASIKTSEGCAREGAYGASTTVSV